MSALRLPDLHPLRKVRALVDELAARGAFSDPPGPEGNPLERLFCALLGGYLLGLRSEHHLMLELRFSDVLRSFVGFAPGEHVWTPSRFVAEKRARFDAAPQLRRGFEDVLKRAIAFKWVRMVTPEDRSRDHEERDDAELPLEVFVSPEHYLDRMLGGDRRRRPRAQAPLDAPDSLASAGPAEAGAAGFPSPEDWRDEVFYSLVLDRFAREGAGRPVGHPEDGTSRHGGNLRGLIGCLDYIAGLGATAIHHTPVTLTLPDAYHGYAPLHLLAVDPHLGTLADYKEFVRAAHERGLRVLPDLVLNHAGPVFEYEDAWHWEASGKRVARWLRPFRPKELDAPEHFSRQGVIADWNDPAQSRGGDFPPDYRRLATENPATQELLIRAAQWWVRETDVDGFRLDAVRHMAPAFLERFSRELKAFASARGKERFLLLGENSTGLDSELAPYVGCLDSLYDYPSYRRENLALHGRGPTRVLEDSVRTGRAALGEAHGRLVRFIDLHDTPRFLRAGEAEGALRCALAYLFTAGGIPLVYYGTEQGFRQAADLLSDGDPDRLWDPRNREDMFAEGRYKSESSSGDRFQPGSELYRWTSALAALRRSSPALRRGDTRARWSDPSGAGILAFSRRDGKSEVLVALNTAAEARRAVLRLDSEFAPGGACLRDVLGGGPGVFVQQAEGGGSWVELELPAYGARVLCV